MNNNLNWIIFDPIQPLHLMICDSIKEYLESINQKNVLLIQEPSLEKIPKESENLCYPSENQLFHSSNTIFIVVMNYHFWNSDINIKFLIKQISKKYKYKILYITEPTFYLAEKKIYQLFIKDLNPFCLWSYSIENREALSFIKHIPQMIIRPFINKTYIWNNDYSEKKIKNTVSLKAVFVGIPNEYRNQVLKQFPSEEIVVIDNVYTYDGWKSLTNEYLIFLNIHRRKDSKHLEMLRLVPLLANYCIVISEKGSPSEEIIFKSNDFLIHFVESTDFYNTYKKIHDELENTIDKSVITKKMIEQTNDFRKNFDLFSEWDLFENYLEQFFNKL